MGPLEGKEDSMNEISFCSKHSSKQNRLVEDGDSPVVVGIDLLEVHCIIPTNLATLF